MSNFYKKDRTKKDPDTYQRWYRDIFHIEDDFLVGIYTTISYDQWLSNPNIRNTIQGYIVFIDEDNNINYKDTREFKDNNIRQEYNACISKIIVAEAQPHTNLSFENVRTFKQMLGAAMLEVMDFKFDAVDGLLKEALNYLSQRNQERARQLFIQTASVPAIIAALAGVILYYRGVQNYWWYGIIFSVLGAFVSIWLKYGKEDMTGLASKGLHYVESLSRIFIGMIFGVIGMYGVKCGIILSDLSSEHAIFVYPLVAFVAAFSERFVPSLIEKIDNNKK